MKTIHYLYVLAIFSASFVACKKYEVPPNADFANTINTEPAITSKIFNQTNNPFTVQFGNTNAVFSAGDKVAIYLPFGINKDVLQTSTITLSDASTEEVLGVFNLLSSTDPSVSVLNVPYDLWYVPFRFITVNIDTNYSGRTITMTSTLTGELTSSIDILSNAFTVQ